MIRDIRKLLFSGLLGFSVLTSCCVSQPGTLKGGRGDWLVEKCTVCRADQIAILTGFRDFQCLQYTNIFYCLFLFVADGLMTMLVGFPSVCRSWVHRVLLHC